MKLDSVESLYACHLQELISIERHLGATLDTLAGAAGCESLKQLMTKERDEALQQATALAELLGASGENSESEPSPGLAGLLQEARRTVPASDERTTKCSRT
jgi:ferritin-like metal-binding protein YciE